jgi:hypothetical protein
MAKKYVRTWGSIYGKFTGDANRSDYKREIKMPFKSANSSGFLEFIFEDPQALGDYIRAVNSNETLRELWYHECDDAGNSVETTLFKNARITRLTPMKKSFVVQITASTWGRMKNYW